MNLKGEITKNLPKAYCSTRNINSLKYSTKLYKKGFKSQENSPKLQDDYIILFLCISIIFYGVYDNPFLRLFRN